MRVTLRQKDPDIIDIYHGSFMLGYVENTPEGWNANVKVLDPLESSAEFYDFGLIQGDPNTREWANELADLLVYDLGLNVTGVRYSPA